MPESETQVSGKTPPASQFRNKRGPIFSCFPTLIHDDNNWLNGMRKICNGILIFLSLYAGTCQGQEYARVTTTALDFEISAYRLPVLSDKQGYLEKSDLSIGTILKSHHFSSQDFNETHNGIYLSVNEWSLGSYTNSGNENSVFITYNPRIYIRKSFEMNLVAGVANGYDGWDYAQDGYLPMLGLSAQWMYVKTLVSFDMVALGLELPLN